MTSTKETNYDRPNERGNGPKHRMEGGDQTDDIAINDPDTREKELRGLLVKKLRSVGSHKKP